MVQVEVKPATPRGSGPSGMPMPARFPAAAMGRGYAEMGAMAAGFPGGAYPGMMPYGPGARMAPMVSTPARAVVSARVSASAGSTPDPPGA